jgi:hypothetical protein
MLGRIDKLWENETPKGQPYLVLAIGDDRYSLWDKKQFGKFAEGDTVEFDWKKAGDYKNITTIEAVEAPDNGCNHSNGKDERIVKMSCLKSAGMILGPMDIEPRKKVLATVSVAKYFERYINDELDGESAGNTEDGKDKRRKYKDPDFGF